MKRTMIVSAFPGCGKTFLFKNQHNLKFRTAHGDKQFTFLDVDSGPFQKEEGWEKRYVECVLSYAGTVDFIFIGQREAVLMELKERHIPYVTVTPENAPWTSDNERQLIKNQWFGRFILRDNSHIDNIQEWIDKFKEGYDIWTSVMFLRDFDPVAMFGLKENQYLVDIVEYLYWKKEAYNRYVLQG